MPRSLASKHRTAVETLNELYISDEQFDDLRQLINGLDDRWELEGIYDQLGDLEVMLAYLARMIELKCSDLRDG